MVRMRTIPLRIIRLATIALVIGLSGCSARNAPSSLSPAGVRAWQANQAVLALGTVQRSAIGLNGIQRCDEAKPPLCAPLLSDGNTRLVIDVVGTTVTAIEQAPTSWRPLTTAALAEVRKRLDATGRDQLAAWLVPVEVVLKEVK